MARITGEQSGATLDLRMTCLDRRRAELANFAGWLATADAKGLGKAVDGLASLGRVADCEDLTRLRDITPMPADPPARATIAAIESELDRVTASARDGKFVDAERASAALVARAQATGYEPLRARALFVRAELLLLQTKTPETLALAAEALVAAEKAGADRLRADILGLELHVELNTLQHVDLAAALADQIAAIGERVHDPTYVSWALGYQSQIDLIREHVPEAVAHAERALALIREPNGREGWSAQSSLASAYVVAHRLDDAARILTGLVASRRAVIGDADDPNLANSLQNLAVIADKQNDKPRAAELMAQATGMLDRTLPVDSKARLQAHTNLATMEGSLGRHAEALEEFAALLPIAEAKLGHDHQAVADIVFRIAESREHLHDLDGAITGYRDALARFTAAKVPLWIAKCHGHIGTVFLESDRPKEALPELAAALAAISELRGPDSPEAAIWRGDVGRVKVTLGDAGGAATDLARALVALDKEGDPVDRGLYRVSLANARWQLGDRPAALELAKQARALLESAGPEGKDGLGDLADWERTRKP
jgi:tetratricopeptide (TPR) repeat protein